MVKLSDRLVPSESGYALPLSSLHTFSLMDGRGNVLTKRERWRMDAEVVDQALTRFVEDGEVVHDAS